MYTPSRLAILRNGTLLEKYAITYREGPYPVHTNQGIVRVRVRHMSILSIYPGSIYLRKRNARSSANVCSPWLLPWLVSYFVACSISCSVACLALVSMLHSRTPYSVSSCNRPSPNCLRFFFALPSRPQSSLSLFQLVIVFHGAEIALYATLGKFAGSDSWFMSTDYTLLAESAQTQRRK